VRASGGGRPRQQRDAGGAGGQHRRQAAAQLVQAALVGVERAQRERVEVGERDGHRPPRNLRTASRGAAMGL
jgi:hypothetical protein